MIVGLRIEVAAVLYYTPSRRDRRVAAQQIRGTSLTLLHRSNVIYGHFAAHYTTRNYAGRSSFQIAANKP
jgi:hypothetical protein